MLIGVDHGNKQIKTVHCNPFVSGLKQSVTRPFGQNVLRYQNTYYTLSTERIPYRKDKTEDDRFFILTLFALAGEIEARGGIFLGGSAYPTGSWTAAGTLWCPGGTVHTILQTAGSDRV